MSSTDYRVNGKRSLDEVERRIRLHLTRSSAARRMAAITTADVRATSRIARRRARRVPRRRADGKDSAENGSATSVNAEINRELTILKRIFNLAVQAGQAPAQAAHSAAARGQHADGILRAGTIRERYGHLPAPLQPVDRVRLHHRLAHRVRGAAARMATGRFRRRRNPTRRRHDEERRGPRVPADRRSPRAARRRSTPSTQRLKKAGQIVPWVFFRMVAETRGGPKHPRRDHRVQQGVEGRLHRRRLPGPHPARPPPHGRPQHGPARRPGARRDAADRAQDALGLRALQHRQRWRSADAPPTQLRGLTGTKKGQSRDTFASTSEGETSEIAK